MIWLEQFDFARLVIFTLVLSRVSGLMLVAPLFGSSDIPTNVRAFLAAAAALLVMPTQWNVSLAPPHNLVDLGLLVSTELMVGLFLSVGLLVLFSGVQLGGQIIAQMSGMTLATVFSPGFAASVPLLSQFFYLSTMSFFLIFGGHRAVLVGLLDTFTTVPLGTFTLSRDVVDSLVILFAESFHLGLRVAAPSMAALLLSTLVTGLISRALPQLNILALGFGINAMMTMAILAVSLGSVAWVFHNYTERALERMFDTLAVPPDVWLPWVGG
ncbi:MAG: flagellar biosynthetic protein FliR [Pirellulales bacterium]